jgi:hypothetical protein
MNLNQQFVAIPAIVALAIVAIGCTRNLIINIITAPLLGIVVTVVPAALTNDNMWLNRGMWIVSAAVILLFLEVVRATPLDFRRALSGVNRRRTARRAVAAEVKGWRFEVENG